MVNILFDCPNISDFKEELSPYISKDSRVAVVAFSFYDDYVYDSESWMRVYGKGIGEGYFEVVDEFATYIDDKGKEPEYRINAEAESYQFWQLIEMTSLTYQERKVIEPNWTRQQIRDYKKSL
ncbi:MAG: hypothetical protein IJC80_07575, partial [Clostridia bacterium]|nr:hypothetical protein [Clostridia bacterium]